NSESSHQKKPTDDNPKNARALCIVVASFDDAECPQRDQQYRPKAQNVVEVDETHVAEQENETNDYEHHPRKQMLFGTVPPRATSHPHLFSPEPSPFPSVVVVHTDLLLANVAAPIPITRCRFGEQP